MDVRPRLILTAVLLGLATVTDQQRVAPGVPPQQYQGQQVPQMQHVPVQQQVPMQQVPMQQQMPVQHVPVQQVPVQQMPVQQVPVQQVPVQQVPVQQVHHGHVPQQQQILNAANIAHEKEHIQEHMEVPIDTSKMSEQELQFHYFKMHDADNNNKLDGCELIKSLIHWHETNENDSEEESIPALTVYTDENLETMIDEILTKSDVNDDGFIDYSEFKLVQSMENENFQDKIDSLW